MQVSFKLLPGYSTFLRSPDGTLARYMMERASIVQLAAIRDCPKKTNKLSESIVKRWSPTLHGQQVIIAALQNYAVYVHEGTGIYGKYKTPIVPTTKKALRWFGDDGSAIFAKSVKGVRPRRFLSDNLPLFFE